MSTKHGRWPLTRTSQPDDPFALWRNPDGQRSLLDRLLTKLLQLQEAMTTATGQVMAVRRIAFLCLFLQELQHELAEGECGYDMPSVVSYCLLWDAKRALEQQDMHAEEIKRGRVVALHQSYGEQHST